MIQVELTIGGQTLAEVKIQRCIFQEDSLLPLQFVTAITFVNYKLRRLDRMKNSLRRNNNSNNKIRPTKEKETYKYLGILEAKTIKQAEIKEKKLKEYSWRTRKLLETKLHGRNLMKWINTLATHLARYSEPF